MRRLLAVVLVLALVAPAFAAPKLRKPPKHRGFQTRVGDWTIGVGEDIEVCEYRRLSNAKAVDVSRFKLRMPPGAHHFALWRYSGSDPDEHFPAGPVESVGCTGLASDEFIPQLLVPTTTPNAEFRLPKGVALRLEPDQRVFLNPHMRNSGTEPIDPDVRFNFYTAKKGTVKHYAEGFTFGNSTHIKIPAGGGQTLVSEWDVPINITMVFLTTHQHALGTYAKVELVEEDGATRTLLVESYDWAHPRTLWPQNGLRLEKGRKLRLTCTWENPQAHEVKFGPETTDEMCYGIGFFYRDEGDTTPVVGSGCIPSKKGLLCPLAPSLRE
jgi:hypothetical protein